MEAPFHFMYAKLSLPCRSGNAVPFLPSAPDAGNTAQKGNRLFSASPRPYPGYLRFSLPTMKHGIQRSQTCQSKSPLHTARSLSHKILNTSFYKKFFIRSGEILMTKQGGTSPEKGKSNYYPHRKIRSLMNKPMKKRNRPWKTTSPLFPTEKKPLPIIRIRLIRR